LGTGQVTQFFRNKITPYNVEENDDFDDKTDFLKFSKLTKIWLVEIDE